MSLVLARLWDPTFITAGISPIGGGIGLIPAIGPTDIYLVKKASVANVNVAAGSWFSCYLIPLGQIISNQFLVIQQQPVSPSQTYPCNELLNLVLKYGDSLFFTSNNANQLSTMGSGIRQ